MFIYEQGFDMNDDDRIVRQRVSGRSVRPIAKGAAHDRVRKSTRQSIVGLTQRSPTRSASTLSRSSWRASMPCRMPFTSKLNGDV
jgi:hypothetical protein